MVIKRWEHFAHDADTGVRGIGASREETFEQAAVALTAVITDPLSLRAQEQVEVSAEAPDDELLLVDWLNALVYEMATRRLLFGRFQAYGRRGTVIDRPCPGCQGTGVVEREKTLTVKVPAGVEDGMVLRIPGHGLHTREAGGTPGDLYVIVHSAPDRRFQRGGICGARRTSRSARRCSARR